MKDQRVIEQAARIALDADAGTNPKSGQNSQSGKFFDLL